MGISVAYLGLIRRISWKYLGHIFWKFWAFLGNFWGISWAYRRHTLGISWSYLRHIKGLCWLYFWQKSSMFIQDFPRRVGLYGTCLSKLFQPNGIKIALLVRELRPFCWIGWFCLLVELHREGSAPAACAADLFFLRRDGASWWRVCYQLGIPHLVYLHITWYCKTIIRHILVFPKWLPSLLYFHGPQFAPLPLPGPVVFYLDQLICIM